MPQNTLDAQLPGYAPWKNIEFLEGLGQQPQKSIWINVILNYVGKCSVKGMCVLYLSPPLSVSFLTYRSQCAYTQQPDAEAEVLQIGDMGGKNVEKGTQCFPPNSGGIVRILSRATLQPFSLWTIKTTLGRSCYFYTSLVVDKQPLYWFHMIRVARPTVTCMKGFCTDY